MIKLKRLKKAESSDKGLYTLDVFIIEGPMTKKFAKKNKVISRTIQWSRSGCA